MEAWGVVQNEADARKAVRTYYETDTRRWGKSI